MRSNRERSPCIVAQTCRLAQSSLADVLAEVRAIRALLYELLQQGTPPSTSPPPNPDPPSRDAMPPITHPPPGQKVDPIDARRQFYKDAGPAITSGLLSANDVNELAKLANDTGWPGALAQLHHARTVAELYQPDR